MKNNYKYIFTFFPTIGILIFILLYLFSSKLYPGGSQNNLNSIGFDWVNNYWCNLMNEKAMNGQVNPARPYAIIAMIILCIALSHFFILFAQKIAQIKFWKFTIQTFGIITMVFAAFIFTNYHDLMTTLSSVFGVFVVVGIIWELYKSNLHVFKISGLFCILLLGINNYIYYTGHLIKYLPLIQKITFAIVLTWIMGLNYNIHIKPNQNSNYK